MVMNTMFIYLMSFFNGGICAGARVRTDSMDMVAQIELAEKQKMKAKVDKILGLGAKCVCVFPCFDCL